MISIRCSRDLCSKWLADLNRRNMMMNNTGWWFQPSLWPKNLPAVVRLCELVFGRFSCAMKGSSDPMSSDLQYLYNPNWSKLTVGSKVSVVITDVLWKGSTAVGKLTPGEQRIRAVGCFPRKPLDSPPSHSLVPPFWTSPALWT